MGKREYTEEELMAGKWRTKCGKEVRVLGVLDLRVVGPRVIVGVLHGDGWGYVICNLDGSSDAMFRYELVPVREVWINEYPDSFCAHGSRDAANRLSGRRRLGLYCVELGENLLTDHNGEGKE